MSKKIRLDQYLKQFQETNTLNKNVDPQTPLTSPHSAMSDEELRIFNQYMHSKNAMLVTEKIPEAKKKLILRLFLRSKRNQNVEITHKIDRNNNAEKTIGKVSAVGRDFVMLTKLSSRIWLPFSYVNSANVPSDIPDYSNSYQHVLYDNNLKKKLLKQFAVTVAKKDVLIQQFYEESLETNLLKWRGTLVEISTVNEEKILGRLINIEESNVSVKLFKKINKLNLEDITIVKTARFFTALSSLFHFYR